MKRTKRLVSLLLCFVMVVSLLGTHVQAGYSDGDECWNCGHYHWDEYMHDCGACSPDCTNDWCALETHCHRCGGCLNGDYPCDECGLCKDCMDEMGHCSQCDSCWMDYGADDVLCGNCGRCEFCSPICPECHMCEDCANDGADGMHCPECGNCYQITEQCEFVENNHCKDCCEPCDQCGECIAGGHLETCPDCGLCVECCEFNSMMEGCESGEICVTSGEWDEHVCEGCGQFFENDSELCETCKDAGVTRCKECCEAAGECSEYMCEYSDEYEDHFCIDCGECFHDVEICSTCEGAGEFRCEDCCQNLADSMGCDGSCGENWCSNDSYFEQHLAEAHEGGDDAHDCTPSNRWSFDEAEHWRACRFCDEDTPEETAQAHIDEFSAPHKLDATNKCVTCGYVKGSKLSITRQPKSVNATVSIAGAAETNPYNVKNNTVTIRVDVKVFNGKKDDLGFNWYAQVTDQDGNEIFNGAVEEMFKNVCFKDEYGYGAIYDGFDSPALTISVPYRACQWKYTFWCKIDTVNSKSEVISTIETDKVQIKASHLYTVCENAEKAGAEPTQWIYVDKANEKHIVKIAPSDGHKWYCVGCIHTDRAIKKAKGQPVMHRYGESYLQGESFTHPGAKVYAKQCQDCRYITYYETHEHVFHTDDPDPERYNRGSFQVNEEKTTNMSHALVCLVDGCGHIKMESHEWDWRHMGYGSDEEGGGTFYRECLICGYPDYDYRPVDKDGNKINWTTENVLVTATNAQVSRTLANEGDGLTLTINNNSVTLGKRCTGWSVKYTTPDGVAHDITSAYAIEQNVNGTWSTTVKLAGNAAGGILLFTPAMAECAEHEFVTEGYVAPACMYNGFAGYRICKHCHAADPTDTRSDEERVISAASTEHTGTMQPLYEKEITSPTGKKSVTWTVKKSESNGKRYNYVAGDCTTKGCEGDFLCTACNRVIPGKREYIHSDELDWVGEIIPTCGRDGYQGDGHCKNCGKFVRKGYVTEMGKGHAGPINYDYDHNEIDPTCTTAGKTSAQFCYTCMKVVADGLPIPPLGHEWVKDDANSTKTTIAYKCSRAGCSATKFADVSAHHAVTVDGGAAYVGGKAVTKAKEGDIVTLKVSSVPDGKRFKEWEVIIGGVVITDATSATEATFKMPFNDVEINAVFEDAPGHSHAYGENWRFDAANHWHECECGDTADLAAHSYVWKTDKEATKFEDGSKHEECSVCGAVRNAGTVIPATLGHCWIIDFIISVKDFVIGATIGTIEFIIGAFKQIIGK